MNNLVAIQTLGTPTLCLWEGDITTPQEQQNRSGEGKEKGRGGDQERATVMY